MKITFITHILSKKGGVEHALMNLVEVLKSKGHEVEIISLVGPNDFDDELNSIHIKVHCLNLKSQWSIIPGLIKIIKIINQQKPDILNAINFFPMLYCALSKPFSQKPQRIVSYHNLGYETFPATTILKKLRKRADILLNKLMDGHTGVSKAVCDSYQHHLLIDDMRVIPNIVPQKKILSSLRTEKCTYENLKNNNQKNIIMAGRFVPEKGYQYMLLAMEILVKKGLDINLEIYGDGPLRDEIEKEAIVLNLQKHIAFKGTVSHSTLHKQMLSANLLVLSSVSEGLPMAIAESMVIGTPVVASAVGGIPEMIEDGVSGKLVAPKDPSALAATIEELLINPQLCKQLSDEGKIRINKKYSSEKVFEKIINYFDEIRKYKVSY
jgi:glycosyltransferase involved in cell wall biosynthesis